MNCVGNVGGAIIPLVIGAIVGSTGSYFLALVLFACFGVGIGLFSLLINFTKRLGWKIEIVSEGEIELWRSLIS